MSVHKRVKRDIASNVWPYILPYYLSVFASDPSYALFVVCSSLICFALSLRVCVCVRKREMSTLRPSSVAVHEQEDAKVAALNHQDLDAGALFVLKSKGDDYFYYLQLVFLSSFIVFIISLSSFLFSSPCIINCFSQYICVKCHV